MTPSKSKMTVVIGDALAVMAPIIAGGDYRTPAAGGQRPEHGNATARPRRRRARCGVCSAAGYCSRPAPGPRGSPQAPHGPTAGIDDAEADDVDTANTDSCFSRSRPEQSGQTAGRAPVTKASKCRPQFRQRYSKRGIGVLLASDLAC